MNQILLLSVSYVSYVVQNMQSRPVMPVRSQVTVIRLIITP